MKNALGIPLKVHASRNLQVVGLAPSKDIYDVGVGQKLELEYAALEPLHRGKLSVLHRQESSMFTLALGKSPGKLGVSCGKYVQRKQSIHSGHVLLRSEVIPTLNIFSTVHISRNAPVLDTNPFQF